MTALLVLSKIHQNVRLHVVIGNGDPVVFGKGVSKGIRSAVSIDHEAVARAPNSTSKTAVMGAVETLKLVMVCGAPSSNDAEVLFLQPRNKLAVALQADHHIHVHQRHVHLDGIVGHALDFVGKRAEVEQGELPRDFS